MIRFLFGFLFLTLLISFACTPEDDLITDSTAQLTFSRDTVQFDTVFTSLGSATRILKVYNPHKQSIEIDRIYLEGKAGDFFRLNVDGLPTNDAKSLIVRPEDSLYVFAEVTIDPDQDVSLSPFVVEDNIVFETNGNTQKILLEAWGQNAIYLPGRNQKGTIYGFNGCRGGEVVFDAPLPYVIFGILVVDDCTLRIPAGAEIYVHGALESNLVPSGPEPGADSIRQFYNDGRLVINPTGRLIVEGTTDNPVTFQGDRLEEPFQEVSGQWFGIYITPGSKNNQIDNAIIKNGIIGVAVDSAAELSISNSQIYNTNGNGLLGIRAKIDADNTLIYDNGAGAVRTVYGGDYTFDYCTLASYGFNASALSMSNALCLNQLCTEYRPYRLNTTIRNSIIFGSRSDELILSSVPEAPFNYNFENTIVRVDELDDEGDFTDFFTNCSPCINGTRESVLFVDPDEDDYHLDTLSTAEGQAEPIPGIQFDLEGNDRDGTSPDIGCYEYQYQ